MNRLKLIGMYLPQFHRVPENDEWWGEGFTEWTAVKSGEKLFEGHNQPRVPLHDNYYNLLEKETMEWQAKLANEHGIYGFCFYHYYFKHGRKILEQPAENLLKWKDINTHFCFCWANETWARTWSNISPAPYPLSEERMKLGQEPGVIFQGPIPGLKNLKKKQRMIMVFYWNKTMEEKWNGKNTLSIYCPFLKTADI